VEDEIKQVIVVRKDIKMGAGKIASQVAHASLMSFLKVNKTDKEIAKKWLDTGEKKIIVKTTSYDEFNEIKKALSEKRIPFEVIIDKGLTQVEPGTETAIGIGPFYEKKIDEVTSKLKLL